MMNTRWFNNYIPAAVWFSYHALVPTWHRNFISALLLFRASVVLCCLIRREQPTLRAPAYQSLIAWVSTFLPTFMVWRIETNAFSLVGNLLVVSGVLLFTFSCLDLDRSFGISPAARPNVVSGTYGYIKHPLYLSHLLVEAGIVICNPVLSNFVLMFLAGMFYGVRAQWESVLINKTCWKDSFNSR